MRRGLEPVFAAQPACACDLSCGAECQSNQMPKFTVLGSVPMLGLMLDFQQRRAPTDPSARGNYGSQPMSSWAASVYAPEVHLSWRPAGAPELRVAGQRASRTTHAADSVVSAGGRSGRTMNVQPLPSLLSTEIVARPAPPAASAR